MKSELNNNTNMTTLVKRTFETAAKKAKRYFQDLRNIFSPIIFISIHAFTILILFFFRLLRNSINSNAWLVVIASITTILLIIFSMYLKPVKNQASKSVGLYDLFLFSFLSSLVASSILCLPLLGLLSYKSIIPHVLMSSFALVLLMLIAFRVANITLAIPNDEITIDKLMHIENFPKVPKDCIIKDIPSEKDLLKRQGIIDMLTNAVRSSLSGGAIAVYGGWGSGKTTIIRQTFKQKLNDILYEQLDVWNYSTEKALLTSIVETIYKMLDIGKDSNIVHNYLKKFVTSFLSTTNYSFIGDLLEYSSNDKSIVKIINDYLVKNNRTIAILLENLDRATDEFVLMVYKAISLLSQFKNVIFICSLDDKRANEILLRNDINISYLDKVFSVTIRVSSPSNADMHYIAYTILDNYFNKYFKSSYEKKDKIDEKIIRLVIEKCDNLRTFIILFNSVSNVLSAGIGECNIIDVLAITLIKTSCPRLLDLISSYPRAFVICNKGALNKTVPTFLSLEKKLYKSREALYNENFSEGKEFNDYVNLLDYLFPDFRLYDYRVEADGSIRERGELGKRIYSGFFFQKYIGKVSDNSKQLIDEELLIAINQDTKKLFYEHLDKVFNKVPTNNHAELFNDLMRKRKLESVNERFLMWYLLDKYYSFDNYYRYDKNTSKELAVNIICEILNESYSDDIDKFLAAYDGTNTKDLVLMTKIHKGLKDLYEKNKNSCLLGLITDLEENIGSACKFALHSDTLAQMYSEDKYDFGISQILYKSNPDAFKKLIKGYTFYESCFVPLINDFIVETYDEKRVYYKIDLVNLKQVYDNLRDLKDKIRFPHDNNRNYSYIKELFDRAYNVYQKGEETEEECNISFPIDNPPSFHYDYFDRGLKATS